MSKRANSLAQIQSYLDDPGSGQPAPAESVLPDEAAPHAAPGTQAGPANAKEQKQQIDLERAQINRDRDQLRLEQEQKSALESKTDQAAAKLQQVVNYSKFRLEGLSMPGGLFLPIALLFLFFLALLPIGGNTRLQWLWQVITNNAALNQAEDLIPVGTLPGVGPNGPTPPPQPTTTPQPPITPTGPTTPIIPLFTGVEQPE